MTAMSTQSPITDIQYSRDAEYLGVAVLPRTALGTVSSGGRWLVLAAAMTPATECKQQQQQQQQLPAGAALANNTSRSTGRRWKPKESVVESTATASLFSTLRQPVR